MFLNLIIVLYNYIPLQICLIQINQSTKSYLNNNNQDIINGFIVE